MVLVCLNPRSREPDMPSSKPHLSSFPRHTHTSGQALTVCNDEVSPRGPYVSNRISHSPIPGAVRFIRVVLNPSVTGNLLRHCWWNGAMKSSCPRPSYTLTAPTATGLGSRWHTSIFEDTLWVGECQFITVPCSCIRHVRLPGVVHEATGLG